MSRAPRERATFSAFFAGDAIRLREEGTVHPDTVALHLANRLADPEWREPPPCVVDDPDGRMARRLREAVGLGLVGEERRHGVAIHAFADLRVGVTPGPGRATLRLAVEPGAARGGRRRSRFEWGEDPHASRRWARRGPGGLLVVGGEDGARTLRAALVDLMTAGGSYPGGILVKGETNLEWGDAMACWVDGMAGFGLDPVAAQVCEHLLAAYRPAYVDARGEGGSMILAVPAPAGADSATLRATLPDRRARALARLLATMRGTGASEDVVGIVVAGMAARGVVARDGSAGTTRT